MSSTQYLTDAATRHAVFLQRYGGGQSKDAQKVLDRLRRSIHTRLMQEPTEFQRSRLSVVLQDINTLSRDAFGVITEQTTKGVQELAKSEARFSTQLFNNATASAEWVIPADTILIASVMSARMPVTINTGVTIDEVLRQFSNRKQMEIANTVTDGVVLGDTTPVIAKRLSTQIKTLNRRQLDTLVRTMTNHTSSVSRNVVMGANTDISNEYKWVSTLDSKTTVICGSRDGKVYPVNRGDLPPAHWGCRSTTVPLIKPEYDIGSKLKGVRPSKGAGGTRVVSGRTTYGGWLRTQPKAFVDEALGVERSKLFRSGKLTIDRFVDPTGRVYSLAELESMHPFAFG